MFLKGKMENVHPFFKVAVWVITMCVLTGAMMTGFYIYQFATPTQTLCQLEVLQILQTFLLFIFPALIAVYLWSKKPMAWLHLDKGFSCLQALLIIFMMILALPGINLLSSLNQQITLPDFLAPLEAFLQEQEANAENLTESFLKADNIGGLFFNLMLMAFLPAIGEEICFRGTCQGLLDESPQDSFRGRTSLNPRTHIAIWVTAILFSLIHFQFYGFIPRMLLGALLGYLLVWTGSLWAPVLAHFTNNAMVVLAYYICDHSTINAESIDNFGSGDTWWAGALSLLLACVMLWCVCLSARKRNQDKSL